MALGGSPRASRALAALDGRSFVTADDVKAAAPPVLPHRLVPRPEHWGGRLSTRAIVQGLLDRVPAPVIEAP